MAIGLVLADDHPIVLHGLQQLLKLDKTFQIRASCASGDEVLPAVLKHRPHVLVADVRMPGRNIFEVIDEMRKANLPTRVVLLTVQLNGADSVKAARLGVEGVVLKAMAPKMISHCIKKVHGGEKWFEQQSLAEAIETPAREDRAARETAEVLSPREVEVAKLLIGGLRNKDIGQRLAISEGTVKVHLHKIYEKLNIVSRLQVTLYARNRGWI